MKQTWTINKEILKLKREYLQQAKFHDEAYINVKNPKMSTTSTTFLIRKQV